MLKLKGRFKKFKNFKNLKEGKKISFKIKISKKIHNDFKYFSGDNSKIHSDIEFCRKNNYKKLMGYGFLITCILSNIYGTKFPGGLELCLSQECKFIKPFFVGDELNFIITIDYLNKNLKLIGLENKVYTLSNNLIFEGKALLKIAFKT